MIDVTTQAIDRAFVRFLDRVASPDLRSDERALLRQLATLVSSMRTEGHSCLNLAEVTGAAIRVDAAPPWRCPAPPECSALLRRAGVASAPNADPTTPLVIDGYRVYLRRYHGAEQRLADTIRRRTAAAVTPLTPEELSRLAPLFRSLFPDASTRTDWQALAVAASLLRPLVVVTGGPGTGKTTVAARLLALQLARTPGARVALAAPTGRAAARLAESMAQAAARESLPEAVLAALPRDGRTLHRLLGYLPATDRFRHGADHPLAEDVVLIDEASMVDVLLMDALCSALKPSARLIILGDPDQLASVETGFVLGDLVEAAGARCTERNTRHGRMLAETYQQLAGANCTAVPVDAVPPLRDAVVRLHHSWRFGRRPGIGALATAASLGDADGVWSACERPEWTDVRQLPPASTPAALMEALREPLEAYLATTTPEEALAALARFRILCAVRDGAQGIAGVTAQMERWLRQQQRPVTGWYEHRPVLITENDDVTGLHNGDVGITLAVDGIPLVHFPDGAGGVRRFAPARLPAHETAWAMTVHKAQGSEFDEVLLVLPAEPVRLLTRELLYTAVTRARECITLMGTREIMATAVTRTTTRHSGLAERLRD